MYQGRLQYAAVTNKPLNLDALICRNLFITYSKSPEGPVFLLGSSPNHYLVAECFHFVAQPSQPELLSCYIKGRKI